MNEDELLELFREASDSEDSTDLDDMTVRLILASPAECSPERAHRIGTLFAEKLFQEIHQEPVSADVGAKWPFHRWIESMRTSVRLTSDDIALALNKDPEFVERLETGEKAPWEFKAKDIGDVVCLSGSI